MSGKHICAWWGIIVCVSAKLICSLLAIHVHFNSSHPDGRGCFLLHQWTFPTKIKIQTQVKYDKMISLCSSISKAMRKATSCWLLAYIKLQSARILAHESSFHLSNSKRREVGTLWWTWSKRFVNTPWIGGMNMELSPNGIIILLVANVVATAVAAELKCPVPM